MAMNDEETVALIAGGHTFGKNPRRRSCLQCRPGAGGRRSRGAGTRLEEPLRSGQGADTITSGLEVTWTTTPRNGAITSSRISSDSGGELTKSPSGANQWRPKATPARAPVPHAHDPSRKIAPSMLTTDLALRFDPAYERSPGDSSRTRTSSPMPSPGRGSVPPIATSDRTTLGPEVPQEAPRGIPTFRRQPPAHRARRMPQAEGTGPCLRTGPVSELVSTAWSLCVHVPRLRSDKRGGIMAPRSAVSRCSETGPVNQPAQLARVPGSWEQIQAQFQKTATGGVSPHRTYIVSPETQASNRPRTYRHGSVHPGPWTPPRTDGRRCLFRRARNR